MSQLVNLLTDGSKYARLNNYPAAQKIATGGERNYSVRKQGDTASSTQAETSADFFSNTHQTGFDVNDGGNTLSINGFRKPLDVSKTHFTGVIGENPTIASALTAPPTGLSAYLFSISNSTRVGNMKYFATDSTKTYAAKNATAKGVILTYNV